MHKWKRVQIEILVVQVVVGDWSSHGWIIVLREIPDSWANLNSNWKWVNKLIKINLNKNNVNHLNQRCVMVLKTFAINLI